MITPIKKPTLRRFRGSVSLIETFSNSLQMKPVTCRGEAKKRGNYANIVQLDSIHLSKQGE